MKDTHLAWVFFIGVFQRNNRTLEFAHDERAHPASLQEAGEHGRSLYGIVS